MNIKISSKINGGVDMKYFGIAFVALFFATTAIAVDRNTNNFQKDALGMLVANQHQRFNELFQFAVEKGKIHVYINVMRPGEITEKDLSKRIAQGRYFAETKSAILGDLGNLVVWHSEYGPTSPNMFMDVRPGALLMILNDSRISKFSIIKNRYSLVINAEMTAEDVASRMGISIATTGHGDDGAGQIIVIIDTGIDKNKLPFPDQYKDELSSCFTFPDEENLVFPICDNTGTGAGFADVTNHIPFATEQLYLSRWHGTFASEIVNYMAPGAEIVHIKVGVLITSASQCAAFGQAAPCHIADQASVDQAFETVKTWAEQGIPITAISLTTSEELHSTNCDFHPLNQTISDLRIIHQIPTFIATGNNGSETEISAPSCLSTAESVSAVVNENGQIADYANRNGLTEWYGIGGERSSNNAIIYDYENAHADTEGTSWAAGQLAAMFAVLKSRSPNATTSQLLQHMHDNANSPPGAPGDSKFPTYETIYEGIDNIPLSTPVTTSESVPCSGNTPRFLISIASGAPAPLNSIEFQFKIVGYPWTNWQNGPQVCLVWLGNNTYHRSRYHTIFGPTGWSPQKYSSGSCGPVF